MRVTAGGPGAFTLFTLTFDVLGTGTSSLQLSDQALGDAQGEQLEAGTSAGSITAAVPEPSSGLLLWIGIGALLAAAFADAQRQTLADLFLGPPGESGNVLIVQDVPLRPA